MNTTIESTFKYFERIGAQWPLILILVSIVFVIYFRKEIKKLISNKRITGIAGVGLEEIDTLDIEIKKPKKGNELNESNESSLIENSEEYGEEVPLEDRSATMASLLNNIFKEEFELAEETYNLLLSDAKERIDKMRISVSYKYFLLAYSTKLTLKEYIDYLEKEILEPSVKTFGNFQLGSYYFNRRDYNRALEIFNLEYQNLDTKKLICAKNICNCYYELEGVGKAIQENRKFIEDFNGDERAELYYLLSEYYDKKGDKQMQFLSNELAVNYDISTKKYEFYSAYNAEGDLFRFVQLFHYDNIFNKSKSGESYFESVSNNRGVTLSDFNLKGLSIDSYNISKKSGGTLAIANIANKLINIGYYDLAEELLKEASKAKEPHENVWSALKEVKEKRNEELETFTSYLEIGKKVYRITQRLAKIKLETNTEFIPIKGSYILKELDVNDLVIKSEWKEFKQDIDGDVMNFSWIGEDDKKNQIKLEFSKDNTAIATYSDYVGFSTWYDKHEGFAVREGTIIDLVVCNNSSVKFFKLDCLDI